MNFDKTNPINRNPQQQKISRNATKKTAQLCGKTVQLATLVDRLPVLCQNFCDKCHSHYALSMEGGKFLLVLIL